MLAAATAAALSRTLSKTPLDVNGVTLLQEPPTGIAPKHVITSLDSSLGVAAGEAAGIGSDLLLPPPPKVCETPLCPRGVGGALLLATGEGERERRGDNARKKELRAETVFMAESGLLEVSPRCNPIRRRRNPSLVGQ